MLETLFTQKALTLIIRTVAIVLMYLIVELGQEPALYQTIYPISRLATLMIDKETCLSANP